MKRLTMIQIFKRLELKATPAGMTQLIKNMAKNLLTDHKTKHSVNIMLCVRVVLYSREYYSRSTHGSLVRSRAMQLVQCIASTQNGRR